MIRLPLSQKKKKTTISNRRAVVVPYARYPRTYPYTISISIMHSTINIQHIQTDMSTVSKNENHKQNDN